MPIKPTSIRGLTVPTYLTIGRMLIVIPVAASILADRSLLAVTLLLIAALSDFLDGYLARKMGQESAIGAALDPIADKMLTGTTLVCFVASGAISGWLLVPTIAILLRETLISGLRETAGTSSGLKVSPLAKIKTSVQFIALIALCFGPALWAVGLLWLAAALTVWTGARYAKAWLASV